MPIRTLAPPTQGLLPAALERHRGRYYGEYAGFVRDRNDPTKTGRCRIWVPALLGNANDTPRGWFDWCLPSTPGIFVPPIDAPVWVTFEQGMVEHGVYRPGWTVGETVAASTLAPTFKGETDPTWHELSATVTKGFGPEVRATIPRDPAKVKAPVYPYNKGFKTENGHMFEIDDSPMQNVDGVKTGLRARYTHPSGTIIMVDADGSVYTICKGAEYHRVTGDVVYQLEQGASFKVVYPNGSGLVVGASGTHVVGDQATILGRAVIPGGKEI